MPKQSGKPMERYTIQKFQQDFPDDAACLEWLKNYLYPNGITCENKTCPKHGQVTKHYRVESRPSYSCAYCGHHVHPTAGTIFHKSPTALTKWFYAVYLMAQTRSGIAAKQIQRELGVTYKCAWRMWSKIRSLLQEDTGPLSGTVEIDETYIGGKRRYPNRRVAARSWMKDKQAVAGYVERGGKIRATHLPDGTAGALMPLVREYVLPAAMIYTDELPLYKGLKKAGYQHRRVNHSQKIYVQGLVHTNTIEGFFGLLKNGIRGVHHSVSAKHLQSYLDMYCFRYNHRDDVTPMFQTMLRQIASSRPTLPAD